MNNHKKDFLKVLTGISHSHGMYEVFSDFIACSAYCIANPFHGYRFKDQYLRTFNKYTNEQKQDFDKCLNIVVEALEEKPQDFLGDVFGELEIYNKNAGQFFTPYHLSYLIAKTNLSHIPEVIARKGYVTINEPSCGAGGMVIAAAEVLKEMDFNPSQHMYVVAQDIASLPFYMAYVQISLLGIPAKLVHGDTLALSEYDSIYTPVYFLENWELRLGIRNVFDAIAEMLGEEEPKQQADILFPDFQIVHPNKEARAVDRNCQIKKVKINHEVEELKLAL